MTEKLFLPYITYDIEKKYIFDENSILRMKRLYILSGDCRQKKKCR